jgi:hypothetical protein
VILPRVSPVILPRGRRLRGGEEEEEEEKKRAEEVVEEVGC